MCDGDCKVMNYYMVKQILQQILNFLIKGKQVCMQKEFFMMI